MGDTRNPLSTPLLALSAIEVNEKTDLKFEDFMDHLGDALNETEKDCQAGLPGHSPDPISNPLNSAKSLRERALSLVKKSNRYQIVHP
jgi:hypothetical protein